MKIQVLPADQYGTIPCVIIGRVTVVWDWPKGKMAWFFWNFAWAYRVGPITVHIQQPK